ncbi:Uncharacterised protein [Pasteurella testudinis]|nr:Uncharacterised protein [Pasteurella testudinis]
MPVVMNLVQAWKQTVEVKKGDSKKGANDGKND